MISIATKIEEAARELNLLCQKATGTRALALATIASSLFGLAWQLRKMD